MRGCVRLLHKGSGPALEDLKTNGDVCEGAAVAGMNIPPPPQAQAQAQQQQQQQQQQQDALLGAAGAGELDASAAGQALLENSKLRFGRIRFKDAVSTVLEARKAPTKEVVALIDELVGLFRGSKPSYAANDRKEEP